jgi:anti-anti-sigma regulatory factor
MGTSNDRTKVERFQVCGNVLRITPRFDPRYQSRAGMELLNIVSGLAAESGETEVVLDISDATALPSMMIGMLIEARDLTDRAGKKLKIRLKTATYARLQSLGLADAFSSSPRVDGVPEDVELIADAVEPEVE